jgi:hypothetical protein
LLEKLDLGRGTFAAEKAVSVRKPPEPFDDLVVLPRPFEVFIAFE